MRLLLIMVVLLISVNAWATPTPTPTPTQTPLPTPSRQPTPTLSPTPTASPTPLNVGCSPSHHVTVGITDTPILSAAVAGTRNVLVIQNTGSYNMHCCFGTPAALCVATAEDSLIQAIGGNMVFPAVSYPGYGGLAPANKMSQPPQGPVNCIADGAPTTAYICEY